MEVRVFPNSIRPGVGQRPRREGQRPLLPQHARHCPVLEAGSALGFLVFPPLEPHESFHIEFQGEGRYQFIYLLNQGGNWDPIFSLNIVLPIGSIGMMKEELAFHTKKTPMSREAAMSLARACIVPEDMGTPPGAIALRGATNFRTPLGWDTVYTPIFNMIERPVAPMLVVRVETDWYPHETEFRYVLQPGEGIPGSHNMPIGQVFFAPREEITLQDCSAEELAAIRREKEEFFREKAASKITTPYGLQYSPHYLRQSRSQQKPPQT
jgi:hypothetical protein